LATNAPKPPEGDDFGGQRLTGKDVAQLLEAVPRDSAGRPLLVNPRFAGAVFADDDVSFSGVAFQGAARFDQSEFLADVTFAGAEFKGTARFDRATFRSRASFEEAKFGGTVWFNGVAASDDVTFKSARFSRDATFDATAFRADAELSEMQVEGDASFERVQFESAVHFRGSTFLASASVERAVFAGDADLSECRFAGDASFAASTFHGKLMTEGTRFENNPDLPEALSLQRRDEPFSFVARATSDQPSIDDVLGFAPLANALHALVDDEGTDLPLTIAVTAPWGAGKSSLMGQLEARLRSPPVGYEPYREWATVSFDAWRYERAERLWAALAKEIYTQPMSRMDFWQALRFRIRLERKRLGPWKLAAKFGWPLLAAGAAVVALLSADLKGGSTVAAVLTGAAAVTATVTRYWGAITDPFKRAIEHYASHPDYELHLGFTTEAENDIRCLMQVLSPDDRHAVAVFVDDLDRCSSGHVVEVVEAMNQIFASRDQRCVFVLGLIARSWPPVSKRRTKRSLRHCDGATPRSARAMGPNSWPSSCSSPLRCRVRAKRVCGPCST
jgi:uncharacterized protein YjbI with pentapeptide repeats